MGTRADFYIGRGEQAEWIGSIAGDGHADGSRTEKAFKATTESAFRAAVAKLAEEDDFTRPEDGWPWPWKTSRTTDYAYAFEGDRVYTSCFGSMWISEPKYTEYAAACKAYWDADEPEGDEPEWPETPAAVFPDMSARSNFTLGKRSGILLVG